MDKQNPDHEIASTVEPLTVGVPLACKLLGVSNATMYRLIADSSLETVKIGRRRMIRYSSLKTLVENGSKISAKAA